MDREFDTAPVPRLVLPHIAPVTEVFCTRIAPRLRRELDEGAA